MLGAACMNASGWCSFSVIPALLAYYKVKVLLSVEFSGGVDSWSIGWLFLLLNLLRGYWWSPEESVSCICSFWVSGDMLRSFQHLSFQKLSYRMDKLTLRLAKEKKAQTSFALLDCRLLVTVWLLEGKGCHMARVYSTPMHQEKTNTNISGVFHVLPSCATFLTGI